MKASYRWLKELSGVDAPPSEVAETLTRLGLEVEDVEVHGEGLDHVVVAEVRAVEPVPDKDKLRLVTVFDGEGERKVICGAPNVPAPGGRVVLAKPGAVLPGDFRIAERKVGGVLSSGMLCSESELGIGAGEAGILVLAPGDAGRPGQPLRDALDLEDHVFEIGLTPNRPDCLGHVGLARELALGFGAPFRTPAPGFPSRLLSGVERDEGPDELTLVDGEEAPPVDTLTLVEPRAGIPSLIPIRIADPERCPRYAGGVVQGVKVGPSPFWLRYRLHVLGLRAIDNVVDVTNLVLYELGHPIHAFDLARLRGPEIIVRLAEEGERMTTLDGEERALSSDDLMICDAEGPVAVAGVMGGADSEIREDTTDVLLEVAYFDPRSVRRTGRRLGLHTDSSHRFERGVDPHGVPWAMRRAASLLCSLAGGAASPVARDVYPKPISERQIPLAPAHVGRLLGLEIPEQECRRALEGVGCAISPGEESGWRVTAPTWRPDLGRPEDLIEEVGRVRGYDAVPTELPRVLPSGRGVAPRLRATRRLREAAADLGLLEAVNFSFVSRADLERARVDTDGPMLANPLSEEREVMRTSLLPGLLSNVARARRHQAGAVALFELARTYRARAGEPLPEEPLELAVALAGPRVEHVGETGHFDFYDGKGVLVSILEAAFGLAPQTVADEALGEDAPYLHPRRRARVRAGGRDVGVLGEVHPDIGDALDLDVRVVFGALDVNALLDAVAEQGVPQAAPLPRFPAVLRDLAVLVPEATEAAAVADVLREAGGALAEDVELFDVYRGKGIPEGQKSLAYRIVYRDPDATLTDKRVEKAHRAVVKAARERLGATVRE
jgi:phenylalanyl-tRNA synthetase beta chain